MPRVLSRTFGLLEIAVLLLPTSFFALPGALMITWEVPDFGFLASSLLIPLSVALAGLIALWRALGAFVIAGPEALRRLPQVWRWLLYMGGVFSGASVLCLLANRLDLLWFETEAVPLPIAIGAAGATLLLPLLHLAVEHKLASIPDQSLAEESCP